jgi:hypothetical protein
MNSECLVARSAVLVGVASLLLPLGACAGAGKGADPLSGINFDASAGDGGDAGKDGAASDAKANGPDAGDAAAGDSGTLDGAVTDGGAASDSAAATDAPSDQAASDAALDSAPMGPEASTCPMTGFMGVLAAYVTTGLPGDEASVPSSSVPAGVTAAPLSRSSALVASSAANSIDSKNWPTTATADDNSYYTISVTPPAGCTLTLTSLAIDVKASADGPTAGDVATSVDAFATHTGSLPGTATTTLPLTASSPGAIELRIYGYQATTSDGSFRVQSTLTLSGGLN